MNIQVKSTELPPFKPLPMKAPDVEVVRKAGRNGLHELPPPARRDASLDRPSVRGTRGRSIPSATSSASARRCRTASTGDWRFITYGEANARAECDRAGAARSRGMGPDTPLMVLSGNSIAHALDDAGRDEGAACRSRRCRSPIR